MKNPFLIAAMILPLASFGCVQTVYRIDLKPLGSEIERSLSVKDSHDNADSSRRKQHDAELLRIEAFYPEGRSSDSEGLPTFTGRFGALMPADVGGSGSFTHFQAPLGSLSIYSERFRGDDDLANALAASQRAADELIDLAIGWLDFEFSNDPADSAESPIDPLTLKSLLDEEIRRDLKNVCLHLWMSRQTEDHSSVPSPIFRLAQYLVERDYLSFQQLPAIANLANQEKPEPSVMFIRGMLLRKLNIKTPKADVRCLDILKDFPRFEKSLRMYLKGTREYQELVSKRRQTDAADTEQQIDEMQIIGERIWIAFAPGLLGGRDRVDVALHLRQSPLLTNGQWDDKTKAVRWSRALSDSLTPAYVFATWSVPDTDHQKLRFGSVVLQDNELAEYVLWYRGLSTEESKQWDTMFSTIDPTSSAIEKLKAFKFDGREEETIRIVDMLVESLKNSPDAVKDDL